MQWDLIKKTPLALDKKEVFFPVLFLLLTDVFIIFTEIND